MSIKSNIAALKQELGSATLIAVSKTKPVEALEEAYAAGQRDFGENYVQELVDKQARLPHDIRWHFIGHLQSNKVKYLAPFVHLIHGVDSYKLLQEINKQAAKNARVIDCLLQVYIAQEQTKFGFDAADLQALLNSQRLADLQHVRVRGLMGMASNTADTARVSAEFRQLAELFATLQNYRGGNLQPDYLSGGMSADYALALAEGCNMVRIGSTIFGERNYTR